MPISSDHIVVKCPDAAINAFEFNDQWKVLIYDKDCRDIISPLMSVMALQKKGVTLHLMVYVVL